VDLKARGVTLDTASAESADDEVVLRTRKLMADDKLPEDKFGDAMNKVLTSDPALAARYRAEAAERTRRAPTHLQ